MICALLTSCHYQDKAPKGDKIIDFRGKEIYVNTPAKRIVCLLESGLSGIYMLQKQESVIGIPSNVYQQKDVYDYYQKLDERIAEKTLVSPGNWDFVNIEQIVGLKPDLVIIWASQTDAIEMLENFGIPVYAVMITSIDDIYKEIRDFGVMLGAENRADELIKHSQKQIKINNDNLEKKKVYFMWAQNITETAGKRSMVEELLNSAGVKNACEMEAEHLSVSIEKIYDWNPDIIVMWYNEQLDPKDIIENPLLKDLKSVKNKQVYELPNPFQCDFWTLKMEFPIKLINHWAYGNENIDEIQWFVQMYNTLYEPQK